MQLTSARGAVRSLFLSACNQISICLWYSLALYSFACKDQAMTRSGLVENYLETFGFSFRRLRLTRTFFEIAEYSFFQLLEKAILSQSLNGQSSFSVIQYPSSLSCKK